MNDDFSKMLNKKVGERSKSAILNKYAEMLEELIGMSDSAQDLYDSQTSSQGSVPIKIGSGKYRQKFAKVSGLSLQLQRDTCMWISFISLILPY